MDHQFVLHLLSQGGTLLDEVVEEPPARQFDYDRFLAGLFEL